MATEIYAFANYASGQQPSITGQAPAAPLSPDAPLPIQPESEAVSVRGITLLRALGASATPDSPPHD